MTNQRHPESRSRRASALVLMATFFAAGAAAQQEPPRFRHLTIAEGLSQSAVMAIIQDRRGFMWLGTRDGLNRYDGHGFVVFHNVPFDSTTLSDGDITALYEDRRGRLWIGTRNGGLNRFDRETQTFRRFADGPGLPITDIAGDEGGLWIGTDGSGLYRYRPEEDSFTRFHHDPSRPASLGHDQVYAVLVDRVGALWVATRAGLNRLDAGAGGDQDSAVFVRYGRSPAAPLGTIDSTVTALHEDEQGRLWVGSDSGISVLAPDRESVEHHYHRRRAGRYGGGRVHDLMADRARRIWVATAAGLMVFDPDAGTFTSHDPDPLVRQGINSSQPMVLFQDRSDVIWVGTNGSGVDIHDPKATRFGVLRRPPALESGATRFSVHTLFAGGDDRVWMGAGVLYRWDRKTGELRSFESTSDRPDDFGNHSVWSIIEDPPGVLWVGSARGLYRRDLRTGATRQFRQDAGDAAGLPEIEVRKVFRARDGALWVVTENYLARLVDEAAGRFVSYRFASRTTQGSWTFPALQEDERGDFWLGTHQGLVRFRPSDESIRHYRSDSRDPTGLVHDLVRSIQPDPGEPERYLWLGTAGGGLDRFDRETGRFTHHTVADGLPSNVVHGILPDDHGHLWLSTNQGLSRFDPRTGVFRNYDMNDGLQGNEFNPGAYFRSDDGELFFGGLNGLNYFRPEQVRDNPYAPDIAITAFRRGNRIETVGDSGSVLTAAISELDRLEIPFENNVVGFEFAALDFSAPEKNRYAYRLFGFNDQWVDAGSARSVTYMNLPPGSYTFQVKGSNNDGVWNETGAAIRLAIVPPWWRTQWAYVAYGLLILALLWWLRHYELGRAQLRNRLEIERFEAEKLRELDRAKSQFFADVSHEFRTPLTLTLGPLDDLLDGLHGPLEDSARDQVGLARRSAARVLDLINQIMELARLESGRTPMKTTQLDLVPFVDHAASPFRSMAGRRTIRLEVVLPARPVHVRADPDQLDKVIANLLSNAMKFTPEGGAVRVTVVAGERTARIAVRDSGPGIPEAEQSRVFDRFYRVERPSAPQSGTGIGLALAKELVELHNGKLWVESEEGFGATFTVELPRLDAPAQPGPTDPPAPND